MKELKNKTEQDLVKFIAEKREAVRQFRFGSTGAKVKNVKFTRTTKKEIARAMTELSIRKHAK
jgi:ribosomal protein L29